MTPGLLLLLAIYLVFGRRPIVVPPPIVLPPPPPQPGMTAEQFDQRVKVLADSFDNIATAIEQFAAANTPPPPKPTLRLLQGGKE